MAIKKISIDDFIFQNEKIILFDVRSPSEYLHACIPGAISLPIFNDEERKIIGIAYKQTSREKAIKIGLEFFGKKTVEYIDALELFLKDNGIKSKEITLHCWRGGMRSAAMAWLFDLYGFEVTLIDGGYKAYRNWVLQQFEKKYPLYIISGYTGSNKTGLLKELKSFNEPVIDLEELALHKGSAFGNLNLDKQPTQEFFENNLAIELFTVTKKYPNQSIWIEDESQRIGLVNIPSQFFTLMRESDVLFLIIPFEKRLNHIIDVYGKFEKEKLINAIERIKKKLGGLETKQAIDFMINGDVKNCFALLLNHYDKHYLKSLSKRLIAKNLVLELNYKTTDAIINCKAIMNYVREKNKINQN